MYIETEFLKYHSNVLGSTTQKSHPSRLKLADGQIVDISQDVREDVLMSDQDCSANGYRKITPQIRFKIVRQWDGDCNTSGSRIRWEIPKNSQFLYD
jgi:hypothetical protein